MVQKWAIGAIINISGSIAINLGTNIMKLSHKMEKGELPPGTFGSGHTPSEAAQSDVEVGASSSESVKQQQQQHALKASSRRKIELVSYSSVPSAEQPVPGGGRRVGASRESIPERDGDETTRLTEEESLSDSPSSGRGFDVAPDDRTELLVNSRRSSFSLRKNDTKSGGRNGGVSNEKGRAKEGASAEEDFDEHSGVRRRTLSCSPRHSLLGKAGCERRAGEGYRYEVEPRVEGVVGKDLAWRTKALWYLGAMLLVAGSLVNFASFGFAPQSLLASLGSVQFISNVVFGKAILHEIVTKRIIFGTATIILGNTLTLCFSPHQDENYNTQQLKAFYDLDYNALLFFELAFALAMHATYKVFKTSKEMGKPRRYSDLAMPLAYAICSAIVGTQSVIQAKCLSELLTMTFQGENQMSSPFTYLVIAVWLGTTVFWLTRMNRALAMFHGLFIIPALQVFWTFFSVIGGGFYFEEFKSLRALGALGFSIGVVVVFIGVYLLAPRTQTEYGRRSLGGREDDGSGGEEERTDLQRMLRIGDDEPAPGSPVHSGPTPLHRKPRSSAEETMEAGDEEIDWDHTRMLSLGFFPSISTDQDVGCLTNAFEVIEPENVVQRLNSWTAEDQGDPVGARTGKHATERVGIPRSKETPGRPYSPSRLQQRAEASSSPFLLDSATGSATGPSIGRASKGQISAEEMERRRRGGGTRGASAAVAGVEAPAVALSPL